MKYDKQKKFNKKQDPIEEKEYIVFTYNVWVGHWSRIEMSKKELEQYIDRNGIKEINIFKKSSEVKFKRIYELED